MLKLQIKTLFLSDIARKIWLYSVINCRKLLTGKQNSSKAGFTKVMYWASTCSSSRPRSLMSLKTERQKTKDDINSFQQTIEIIKN